MIDFRIPYIVNQQAMVIVAGGVTPGRIATVYTVSATNLTPRVLTSSPLDATRGFKLATRPPPFTKPNGNVGSFVLIAADTTDPAAPAIATFPFQVVRFGLTRRPSPKRPVQTVTYIARAFTTGKPTYAHFRFGGLTRRTVNPGIARGPCGIASKRMRALPTKIRYGSWRSYIDQSTTFSVNTRPQWIDPFTITRVSG